MITQTDFATKPMTLLPALRVGLTLVMVAIVASCGDNLDDTHTGALVLETPFECNPLGGVNCMTPWPCGIYQEPNTNFSTGFRNAIPLGALPTNQDNITFDADLVLNKRGGFSPGSPLIMAFASGIDGSNLVHYSNYPASTTAASPTVLMDAKTGELVEHFAELDTRTIETPGKQALLIRSSKRLKFGNRYIVAIKKSLKAKDGSELAIPEGFAAILNNETTTHPLLERMRPRFDGILAMLAQAGVDRDELVVAWDFTTMAKDEPRRDMLAARSQALAAVVDGNALAFTVTSDVADDNPVIARRIEGTFTVPLFLTEEGRFTPGTVLNRDGDGAVKMAGFYQAPFVAVVPQCAVDSATPVPLMMYGHGLLGTASQVASGGVIALITRECMIAYGTDFRGFSTRDISNLALTLNNFNKQDRFFPIQIQGVIDHIILTQTAQGPMADDLFVAPTKSDPNSFRSLVDPNQIFYYGISQGAIMGATVMSYEPTIERAVLQVGAINYSLLLDRSLDWLRYQSIMVSAYPDPLDVSLLLGLMQELWDMDPANSVGDLLSGGVADDVGAKQILLQMAVADDVVANLATEYQARTMGLSTLLPSVYEPYEVPGAQGPLASGLVIYDYDLGDTIPPGNEAPPDNEVHNRVRRQAATISQIGTFFKTGNIVQFCGDQGCECAVGDCGESF